MLANVCDLLVFLLHMTEMFITLVHWYQLLNSERSISCMFLKSLINLFVEGLKSGVVMDLRYIVILLA